MNDFEFFDEGIPIGPSLADSLLHLGREITAIAEDGRVFSVTFDTRMKIREVFNPEKTITKHELKGINPVA